MKNFVVGSIVLMLVTLGWGARSVGEQPPAPRGELRIVDKSPMNWISITFNVFEHLIETRQGGQAGAPPGHRVALARRPYPGSTLRQGVTFHNGESLRCRDRQAQLGRTIRGTNSRIIVGLFELQPGVAAGDRRSVHRPVRVSGTGRRGAGQTNSHAHGQPPVLSRIRLGGEAVVNDRSGRPVGHGAISAGGRILRPEQAVGPGRPGSQSALLGSHTRCHASNGLSLTTR